MGLTEIHDVIPAYGAVVYNNIPRPERHSVPLLHFKPLLAFRASFGSLS